MLNNVAIVLSTYNGSKFLDEFLISLTNQDFQNFSVYIRDDGSTDDTLSILQSYSEIINMNIIKGVNVGYIKSYHELLSMIKEDIIFLADQDDVWHPKKISTFLPRFEKNHFVHCNAELIDMEGNVFCDDYHESYERVVSPKNIIQAILNPNITGCCVAVRREVAELALKFPPHIPHDRLLLFVAISFGQINYISSKLVKYRQHTDNAIGVKASSRSTRTKVCNFFNSVAAYRSFALEGKFLLDGLILNKNDLTDLNTLYSKNILNTLKKIRLLKKNLLNPFAKNFVKKTILVISVLF